MIDLSFKNVSKRYSVRQEVSEDQTRNRIVRKIQNLRRVSHDFWALRDVSFEVRRGEAVGIIGHNGAGKSTILKLLANITAPTKGEIKINGRLSALIEVGSGFHPELTGRENIYLNGSILGMRRREITEKLDSIVEFAGIREFLDTPVKRFSSGMYVRLGFSIAAHLDPDILLLDEVLAVGDAAFQAKCLQRIDQLKNSGTTIVFISHDLGSVERICDRVILLKRGEIEEMGPPREVIAHYQREGFSISDSLGLNIGGIAEAKAKVTSIMFIDGEGREATSFQTGDSLTVQVGFKSDEGVDGATIGVFFFSQEGELQCEFTTNSVRGSFQIGEGDGTVEFQCERICLQPGIYYVDVSIEDNDWQHQCATLRIDPGPTVTLGSYYMPYVVIIPEKKLDKREETIVI